MQQSYRFLCQRIRALKADEGATTAIEYSLLGALLAVACIVAITQLSDEIVASWTTISDAMSAATTPSPSP